jgi:hypothetical protein
VGCRCLRRAPADTADPATWGGLLDVNLTAAARLTPRVSPGLVAARAWLYSPLGQTSPELLLSPEDVAGAVEYVVTFPGHGCPVLIELQPLAQGSER